MVERRLGARLLGAHLRRRMARGPAGDDPGPVRDGPSAGGRWQRTNLADFSGRGPESGPAQVPESIADAATGLTLCVTTWVKVPRVALELKPWDASPGGPRQ